MMAKRLEQKPDKKMKSSEADQLSLVDFLKTDQKLAKSNVYAHNHNLKENPIENWFTLVAGFSGNFVKECFKKYDVRNGQVVLDPFVGTGTTALVSMFDKKKAIGVDINPFNHIVAKTKTNFNVDKKLLGQYLALFKKELKPLMKEDNDFVFESIPVREIKSHLSSIWENRRNGKNNAPDSHTDDVSMPHLQEWISPTVLKKISILKKLLKKCNSEINSEEIENYGIVAFGAILIPISNMQLAGPKIAYRRKQGQRVICLDAPVFTLFMKKLEGMVTDAEYFQDDSQFCHPELYLGDARKLDSIIDKKVDIAITSPPYLNEVDYLDNTRLQLYLLDYLSNDTELRQLKQQMIRANSKYLFNNNRDYPGNTPKIATFDEISLLCEKIGVKRLERKWGWDHPRLVAEYFIDMTHHLQAVKNCLHPEGHYIIMVGDSAINQVLVPTDMILSKIALDIGFSSAQVEPFRWRGSSRHTTKLQESLVILKN